MKAFMMGCCFVMAATCAVAQNSDWKSNFDFVYPLSDGMHRVIKERKMGFCDAQGHFVIPAQYRLALDFKHGLAPVEQNDKWGFINKNRQIVIAPLYDGIFTFYDNGLAIVIKDNYQNVINTKGETLLKDWQSTPIYVTAESIIVTGEMINHAFDLAGNPIPNPNGYQLFSGGKDLLIVRNRDHFFGVMNTKGEVQITPQYEYIWISGNGDIIAEKKGNIGLINRQNEILAPFEFQTIGMESDGLLVAKKNDLYGYIDTKGKTAIPFEFSSASLFVDGEALVKKNEQYLLINTKGETIYTFPNDYTDVERCKGLKHFEVANKEGLEGLVDKKGNIIIPFAYNRLFMGGQQVFFAQKDKKWGLLDSTGKVIIPIEYEYFDCFYEAGVVHVNKEGKTGILDMKNTLISDFLFEREGNSPKVWVTFSYVYPGWVPVSKDGKAGYIDFSGRTMIDFQYEEVEVFVGGEAYVKKDGKYGIITPKNEWLIEPLYENLKPLSLTKYIATYKGMQGIIDTNNQWVAPPIYDEILGSLGVGVTRAKKDGKYGAINLQGETIIPFEYNEMYVSKNYICVAKGDKKGLLSMQGKVILPMEFGELSIDKNYLVIAQKGDKMGIVDLNNQVILPFEYEDLQDLFYGWYPAKKDGFWGGVNTKGETVMPFQYDDLRTSYSTVNPCIRVKKGDYYGFVDKEGKEIIAPQYKKAEVFSDEKWVIVESWQGVGCIDINNKEVIACQYQALVWSKKYAIFWAKKNGRWGILNANGEVLMPFVFEGDNRLEDFHLLIINNEHIVFQQNGRWGMVNMRGETVLAFEYEEIYLHAGEGNISIKKGGKYGALDKYLKIIVPCQYEESLRWVEGFAEAKKYGKYGIINTKNEAVIPLQYSHIELQYSSDIVWAKKDGYWGALNLKNKVVVDFQYQTGKEEQYDGISFNNGISALKKGSKWGFVRVSGEVLLPFEYDKAEAFYENFAKVQKAGKWGLIDKKGQAVIPFTYEDLTIAYKEEYPICAKKSGKWGFINLQNTVLVEFLYDELQTFSEGLAAAKKGNYWGYINEKGETVIPYLYDLAGSFYQNKASVYKNGSSFTINTKGVCIENCD